MNARRVGWLLVAGLVVIGFAIWVSSLRHLERATLAGDLVLPGLEHGVNTVTEVRLHKADDIHTTLQKGASGWLVAERGWPAEVNKVRKLLLDLGALNVVEEKTRLSANYPALGVEDLSTPQGERHADRCRLPRAHLGTHRRQALGRQVRLRARRERPAELPRRPARSPWTRLRRAGS